MRHLSVDSKSAGVLEKFNISYAIDFSSLLYIGSMSSNSQSHQIFPYCEFFCEPNKQITLKKYGGYK